MAKTKPSAGSTPAQQVAALVPPPPPPASEPRPPRKKRWPVTPSPSLTLSGPSYGKGSVLDNFPAKQS
eukprot:1983220-Lingulodinium_polyedra.AAC.1